jgi:DNA-binding response OmpR family regulator
VQDPSIDGDGGTARVLVVEDDRDVRDAILSFFERESFELAYAADGPSAVELARTFRPDVILLDMRLPEMSGVEVCERVRTFSDAYILMLTASDELSDKLVGLSVGADDYVTKPCSMPEIVARIRALRRRSRV